MVDWTPQLQKTVLKVVVPLLIIAGVFVIARFRRLSWREDLGLIRPPAGESALWIAVYAAWMLLTDWLMGWRGPWDFTVWAQSPLIVDVLRVLAVSFLGPIGEELAFRGLLYGRLVKTRLGVAGTIVVLAAGWAAIHTDYSLSVILVIFVGGLLLGAARYRTGSVLLPIVMHILWNLYAVW
ncbi:MAG TPA: CPBP family intramembrane glutamic endopeptidase [Acidobacteriaceae bacterium]|jgi:membrane protease YdiL (CAAX protease family)|nr:CPBP family intramembrane glutamic endopeptidase [Acidobacteriaceae bacterium]